jgi:hypothetical protein
MSAMETNLFGDDPALDPSLSAEGRFKALRQARVTAYADELYCTPPVRSCSVNEVGHEEANRNASRLAAKDEARMNRAENAACLTIVSMDRLSALEKALGDWLTASDEDASSGGNGSDSIDVDELTLRTGLLLAATTLPEELR